MQKKKRTNLSASSKQKVIIASLEPGCDIQQLSQKYKISPNTLIRWRRGYKKQQADASLSKTLPPFVEVQVEPRTRVNTLKKVELSFDNHRCSVEGKLNSTQLLKLVELLEEAVC